MVMRSWVLKSWPEVMWQAPEDLLHGPVFQHMGTDVRAESDDLGRLVGETVWAARLADDQLVGLAWEWVEILPGVPAIRDPNGIVANLRLLNAAGAEMDELQSIVGLNRIAHAVPWQRTVAQMARGAQQDHRFSAPKPLMRARVDAPATLPGAALGRQPGGSLARAA
jgi:hypothetical protein